MPEHETLSQFVKSASMRIYRRAIEYGPHTDYLLDVLNQHVEHVVDDYRPPGVPPGRLMFAHVYTAAWEGRLDIDPDGDALASTALLAALLAAEVEFRGPQRLTGTQIFLLAEVYERLGGELMTVDLPRHAALAFRRAAWLYRHNEDTSAEDRCGLALARARCRAQPHRRQRLLGQFTDLVCGYGYRPFRLLGFVALQLLLFTALGLWICHGQSVGTTIYICATSYLNPLGPSDTNFGAGRTLFAVESWAGAVSMAVFFTLLVRRWFRL